jgi:hypothetical protein
MNFPKLHNYNIGSIKTFVFVDEQGIDQWPDVILNTMQSLPTLKSGYVWNQGYSTQDSKGLVERTGRDNKGVLHTHIISGVYPRINSIVTSIFTKMLNKRYIVVVEDNNGESRILGRPGNGLKFTFEDSTQENASGRNSYSFTFSGNSRFTAPHISEIPVIQNNCAPATYQVIDQNENILASGTIPSGADMPIPVTVPPNLDQYTCQQLKDGLTPPQKICIRNKAYYTQPLDVGGFDLILPNMGVGQATYSSNRLACVYEPTSERYFIMAREAASNIRVFSKSWNFIATINMPTGNNMDLKVANGFVWRTSNNTVSNLTKINPNNLTITEFTKPERAGSMIEIGGNLVITPANVSGQIDRKLYLFNTTTNVFTQLNSNDSVSTYISEMGYDGVNIIAYQGTALSVISFYSISANANVANINFGTDINIISANYVLNQWYIICQNRIFIVNPTTYAITKTIRFVFTSNTQLTSRSLVYQNRYIVISSGNSISYNIIFDCQTERFFNIYFQAVPFLNDLGQLSFFGINSNLEFPSQPFGVFVINNYQL